MNLLFKEDNQWINQFYEKFTVALQRGGYFFQRFSEELIENTKMTLTGDNYNAFIGGVMGTLDYNSVNVTNRPQELYKYFENLHPLWLKFQDKVTSELDVDLRNVKIKK